MLKPEPLGHRSRPRRRADNGWVGRERVVARFAESVDTSTALLSAPAGYGKTTVLSQWEEVDTRPFAWIPLDDRYNDPALLVGSIVSSLDELEPMQDGVLAPPVVGHRPNLADVVVPRLCEALGERERPFVLVLDDVHCLQNPESVQPLAEIAENVPAGSKLAIASRDEPAIPLGRLRTRRLLVELRAQDLVMTAPEATTLLEHAGLRLEPHSVERLIERTEGWPAGLYLAALALCEEDDVDAAVDRFYGDDRLVADYLREEFLSALPPEELDFLTRTSILDRLSGPLCDAVLQREGSAEILKHLARSNLLLVPLDRRDREYRYHALLREMLESELHRLDETQAAELHGRASRWFAGDGDLDRAVPHAIAAGDSAAAADLIWANTASYESRGRGATLRRWLNRFTAADLTSSAPLCLALATTQVTDGDGSQVEHWAGAATEALKAAAPPDSEALARAVKLIRASGAAREGIGQMGTDVAGVYESLPENSPWRALCCLIEGVARHLAGEGESARRLLEEGSRRGATAAPSLETLCLAQLALLALEENDLDDAEALASRALEKLHHFGLGGYPTQALVFAVAALVRAGRGRAAQAARDVRAAEELLSVLDEFSPWYEAETRIVIARVLLLLDHLPEARARLGEAGRHLRRTPDATVLREWLERTWQEVDSAQSVTGRWPLSPAELRLLHSLPTHLTFREIADELFVSANTVKTQARSIYQKLGVSSRAEAVACAKSVGLLDAPD